ncbi:hypothetical protein [Actinoplanes sp. NPDC049316]|uniref:hypothetical protein n=1 Tax=Actinoplanes sp. NPDC049316 TaxID=3154727 RepID=UPI00342D0306
MRRKPRVDLHRVDPATAWTILIGLLATATVTGGPRGRQALAVVTVAAYSFATTWLIAAVLIRTVRVDQDDEHGGLVLAVYGETAYDLVPHAVGGCRTASHPSRAASARPSRWRPA